MESTTLRQKLHKLIDDMPDDKLNEVYTTLIEEEEYSDEFKAELDEEYAAYKKDSEVISKEDVDKLVEQLLYGRK